MRTRTNYWSYRHHFAFWIWYQKVDLFPVEILQVVGLKVWCESNRMAVNAGQTLNDRLLAARHSIAGQGLAKAVCKATTEELIGPKKKHLDCKTFLKYLVIFLK